MQVLCQQKGGIGGGGCGNPQGNMHMVPARLGFERVMIWTGCANSRPDCMDRLRNHYSHLVGGWFLASRLLHAC